MSVYEFYWVVVDIKDATISDHGNNYVLLVAQGGLLIDMSYFCTHSQIIILIV
jgi:hypothetical protein